MKKKALLFHNISDWKVSVNHKIKLILKNSREVALFLSSLVKLLLSNSQRWKIWKYQGLFQRKNIKDCYNSEHVEREQTLLNPSHKDTGKKSLTDVIARRRTWSLHYTAHFRYSTKARKQRWKPIWVSCKHPWGYNKT